MSQEYFDIVDENNIPTGEVKSRDEVHRHKTDWHRAVQVWIVNDRGEILCQQRSWKKDGNPGMWQSFFGGHVKTGQTVEECLQEELLEEIGIDIVQTDALPVFINVQRGEVAKHFGYTYVLQWNGDIANIVFNDGEVERVVWMELPMLESWIGAGEFCNTVTDPVREYLRSIHFPNV